SERTSSPCDITEPRLPMRPPRRRTAADRRPTVDWHSTGATDLVRGRRISLLANTGAHHRHGEEPPETAWDAPAVPNRRPIAADLVPRLSPTTHRSAHRLPAQ